MNGISVTDGKLLGGVDHLRQSVRDILMTPLGSRIMRRDYGSRLFELIDAPINRATIMEIYAATAEALEKWEPRLQLQSVQVVKAAPGEVELDMTALYLPEGKEITLEGIIVT